MKDIGKMIFKMAKVWKVGRTDPSIKEDTKKA